jgi:hypothetical protein
VTELTGADIVANVLMDALTRLSLDAEHPPHPAGLVQGKTVIEGDLGRLTLDFPLRFDGCVFTGWLDLDYPTLVALRLDHCSCELEREHLSFGAIKGRSGTVRNGLDLSSVLGQRSEV